MKCFIYMRLFLAIVCFSFISILGSTSTVLASPISETLSITSLKDSIEAAEDANLLVNKVTISNNTRKVQRIGVRTKVPKGWKNLSKSKHVEGDDVFYNLSPGQVISIPINLLRLPNASPEWSPVTFLVWNREMGSDTQKYAYYIKNFTRKKFVAFARNQNIEVTNNIRNAAPITYIKNTGNVADRYVVKYRNYNLNIDDSAVLILAPGQDTLYEHSIEFNPIQFHSISSEKILVTVGNTSKLQNNYSYTVNKYAEKNKVNKTPYDAMPLSLEGGYMTFGDKHVYYGSFRGKVPLGEKRFVDYSYRSKQYGNVPTGIRRNIFRVQYKSEKWDVTLGQVSAPLYFILNTNRGIDIKYETKKFRVRALGTAYDSLSYYKNNNIQFGVDYTVKNMGVSQVVIYNHNQNIDVSSYALLNEVNVFSKEKLTLGVRFGVGQDVYNAAPVDVKPGGAAGYSFKYKIKKNVTFSSVLNYYNMYFPGIKKGSSNQVHDVTWKYKNGSASLFYSSNNASRYYFRDSLFNSDVLTYNISRLGLRINKTTDRSLSSIGGGLLTQNGSSALNGGLKNSFFFDLMTKHDIGRDWHVSFNTQTAFGKDPVDKQGVFAITSALDVNSRYVGLTGVLTRMPITSYDAGRQSVSSYTETVNGGPYVNFYMLRNRLFGSLRYNFSKSLQDDVVTQGVGGSLSYVTLKSGLNITVSSFYPFGSQTNDPGLPIANRRTTQVSLSKQFNIPIIVKRKYYDLKAIMYEDKNGNHKMDPGEKILQNIRLLINDDPFISNSKGEVLYKNISNGTYQVKIHDAQDNTVPLDGFDQTITVYKNTKVEIPFKKGRIITGKVNIELAAHSSSGTSPDLIKITAMAVDGVKYTTLSDKNGDFSLAVPAGEYKVSVDEAMFAGSNFKAVQPSFAVDLDTKETAEVTFVIKEKVRKIRYLKK